MLPRNRRVHKDVFQEVLKKGLSFHSKHISLRGIKKDEVSPSSFSFSVPKKVAIKAVDRNLLRRRATSITEKYLPQLKKGISAVFFFRSGSLGLTFRQIEEEIVGLLRQSGLLL